MLGAEPERRKSLPARLAMGLRSILEAERSRWFLWAPVILACGIAAYFILPVEPPVWAVAILGLIAAFGLVILARGHGGLGVALISIFLAGIVVAKVRVEISGPQNMVVPAGYVQVTGWLERAGARSGGGTRMILKPTSIDGLEAGDLPQRVRLIWRGKGEPLPAGSFVVVKARFMPRSLPVWPGGYDAGFFAWFDGIGAQGFTLAAPQKTELPDGARVPLRLRLSAGIENVRKTITKRVMAALPASTAPLAAALITGERGALGRDLTETLRRSGLAHLLAISGLHMALFAGGVFWVVRALLALSPGLAVTRPIKKWAALAAIASGFFYLLMSGMGLATQRAFIMITIMLVAVLIERPALTMRNVALAAWVILLARAESIMSVSFQMSFMAVVCLVGVYEWRAQVKAQRAREYTPGILASAWRYGAGLMLTTLVAGAATAPIAAYQFNRVAVYGVLANLAAVPVVGALVMPMAVLALVFMPFGLEAYPLWVMGQGLDIVLVAATWVADLGGAVRPLAAMPLAAPVAMVAGLLWLSLWQGTWRLAGVAAILAGFWIAPGARLPDVLIGADGKLIAMKNLDKTLTLNTARAEKYTATRWLAKFGDPASLKMGVARSGIACDRQGCAATSPDGVKVSLVHSPAILDEECGNAEIVIVNFRMKGPCPSAKVFITRKNLKRAGMHAIYLSQANGAVVFEVRTARFRQGLRPWNGREMVQEPAHEATTRTPQVANSGSCTGKTPTSTASSCAIAG